jgi:hypothetical protein
MMRTGLAVGAVGVALAVLAIFRDDRRIAWVAMVVLGAAVVIRGITRWRARHAPGSDDDGSA